MNDFFHPNNMRNFKNTRETSLMDFFLYHKKHSHTLWHVLVTGYARWAPLKEEVRVKKMLCLDLKHSGHKQQSSANGSFHYGCVWSDHWPHHNFTSVPPTRKFVLKRSQRAFELPCLWREHVLKAASPAPDQQGSQNAWRDFHESSHLPCEVGHFFICLQARGKTLIWLA